MRTVLWLVLAAIALLIVGLCPSVAVALNGLLGMAGGVAIRGVLAVLEQPYIQAALVLGIVVRHLVRRRAA